jgi:anti-anti-sigma factor
LQTNAATVLGVGLRILVSQIGGTSTVALEGEWDLANQVVVRECIGRVLSGRPERLALDLSRLSFIDASAVHAMVSLVNRTERLEVCFRVVRGPRAVQRIFEICRITDRVRFIDAA